MPLTRTNVTAASRVMLPSYPLFFGLVGLGLLLTDRPRLLDTPAFRYADQLLDIRWWGAGFLALALALVGALLVHHRSTYKAGLGIAIVWMGGWAVLTFFAAFGDRASFTAWSWPALVATACWASLVSLEGGET